MSGEWKVTNTDVKGAFLEYYQGLLGTTDAQVTLVNRKVVRAGNLLTQAHKDLLMRPYTSAQVRNVMFAMDSNRAPGPDGFGSFYFKTLGIFWEAK